MIETRKTEERYTTSDPKMMLGKYTTSRVYKTWTEDMVDENGEVVSIERNQMLFDRGIYINNDVLTEIKFWLEEGSVKEIEVSNQKRLSYLEKNNRLFPYKAIVGIDGKKHSFLLYATSIQNATEIINDYVELNFVGGYNITGLNELDYCVILVDKLKTIRQRNIELDIAYLNDEISIEEYIGSKVEDTEDESDNDNDNDQLKLRFYQIVAKIICRLDKDDADEEEYDQKFIVRTFSAVRANLIIQKYLQDCQEERYQESLEHPDRKFVKREILSFIEESKILSVGDFIPRQFSEAYVEE